ncbi:GNAT family N-acetyltransferase [Ideonella sp. BN130291]|uniref:GNAT family N-acetyltransferase n=1 Tax=Ideonella sp. BN130291 TaxID=3112940 RepID=UPI002E267A48|nr:GNAT family N-acetyltransferase [Ideonella sp. BN130291]
MALPQPQFTLEPLTSAHAEEMYAVLSDPAIYLYIEDTPPTSVDHVQAWFTKLEARRSPDGAELWLNWVVRDAAGQATGYVQATVLAPHTAFVAYVFASAHWGRGLAKAAMGRMLRLLADEFGVEQFRAVADRRNTRSVRLLQSLGFELAERQPEATGDVAYSLSSTRIE